MKNSTKKTVLKYCEKFEAAGESVGEKTTVVFERWDRFTNSWKFGALIAVVLIIVYALSGCKSAAQKLEENLISQEWVMTYGDNSSVTINFYKNNTAVIDSPLINVSYSWAIDDDESLILTYTSSSKAEELIYKKVEDDTVGGYVLTSEDEEVKLTPANKEK